MMIRQAVRFTFLIIAGAVAGCASETAAPPAETGAPAETQSPEVAEALAQLSPEDRALAEQQKICPVSEEPLGSMGAPVKIDVEGQSIFICCEGCEEIIREDPETYLAKVNK
ncbi:MAG: hypothetical protein KY475_15210 [Planctomycetes bacterium]|nr:hypothetical protein [Planctomycetota bacterium]